MEIYGTDLGFWDKAHRTQDWIWRFKRTEQNDADSAVVRRKRWWWWWRRRWRKVFLISLCLSCFFVFSLLCLSVCVLLYPTVRASGPGIESLSVFHFILPNINKKAELLFFLSFFFFFPFFVLNKFFISCVLRI